MLIAMFVKSNNNIWTNQISCLEQKISVDKEKIPKYSANEYAQ